MCCWDRVDLPTAMKTKSNKESSLLPMYKIEWSLTVNEGSFGSVVCSGMVVDSGLSRSAF